MIAWTPISASSSEAPELVAAGPKPFDLLLFPVPNNDPKRKPGIQ
jgi:hypothetical protein